MPAIINRLMSNIERLRKFASIIQSWTKRSKTAVLRSFEVVSNVRRLYFIFKYFMHTL
jgi:hypothetical protein